MSEADFSLLNCFTEILAFTQSFKFLPVFANDSKVNLSMLAEFNIEVHLAQVI